MNEHLSRLQSMAADGQQTWEPLIHALGNGKISGSARRYQHLADPHHPPSLLEERRMAANHPIVIGVTFKDIPGFIGYCVGNDGSIWSSMGRGRSRHDNHPWRKLTLLPCPKSGHLAISLSGQSGKKRRLVHRLVLEAFVGPCPAGMECCHFPDRDPANNHLDNLRWDTRKANCEDARLHGTFKIQDTRGEANGLARLTVNDVIEMRRLNSEGLSCAAIARQFGVSASNAVHVVRRLTWRHIP